MKKLIQLGRDAMNWRMSSCMFGDFEMDNAIRKVQRSNISDREKWMGFLSVWSQRRLFARREALAWVCVACDWAAWGFFVVGFLLGAWIL